MAAAHSSPRLLGDLPPCAWWDIAGKVPSSSCGSVGGMYLTGVYGTIFCATRHFNRVDELSVVVPSGNHGEYQRRFIRSSLDLCLFDIPSSDPECYVECTPLGYVEVVEEPVMSASPFVVSRHPSARVALNFLIETERPRRAERGLLAVSNDSISKRCWIAIECADSTTGTVLRGRKKRFLMGNALHRFQRNKELWIGGVQ